MDSKPSKKTASVGNINFQPITPLIDLSFWLKFTSQKLDVWKLDCPQIDITTTITLPMNQTVPSSILIDESSLTTSPTTQKSGGLLQFTIPGLFIHLNTIEEYNSFTFDSVSKSIPKTFDNFVVLICFGDLKNYDFYYRCALVQGKEKF
jgi:hypothetical protein